MNQPFECLESRIKKFVVEAINKKKKEDQITLEALQNETNLVYDLGMDSIEMLTIITKLEQEFDVEFLDDDMDMDNMIVLEHICESLRRAIESSNRSE